MRLKGCKELPANHSNFYSFRISGHEHFPYIFQCFDVHAFFQATYIQHYFFFHLILVFLHFHFSHPRLRHFVVLYSNQFTVKIGSSHFSQPLSLLDLLINLTSIIIIRLYIRTQKTSRVIFPSCFHSSVYITEHYNIKLDTLQHYAKTGMLPSCHLTS